ENEGLERGSELARDGGVNIASKLAPSGNHHGSSCWLRMKATTSETFFPPSMGPQPGMPLGSTPSVTVFNTSPGEPPWIHSASTRFGPMPPVSAAWWQLAQAD